VAAGSGREEQEAVATTILSQSQPGIPST
jgi:hypothetical protein